MSKRDEGKEMIKFYFKVGKKERSIPLKSTLSQRASDYKIEFQKVESFTKNIILFDFVINCKLIKRLKFDLVKKNTFVLVKFDLPRPLSAKAQENSRGIVFHYQIGTFVYSVKCETS